MWVVKQQLDRIRKFTEMLKYLCHVHCSEPVPKTIWITHYFYFLSYNTKNSDFDEFFNKIIIYFDFAFIFSYFFTLLNFTFSVFFSFMYLYKFMQIFVIIISVDCRRRQFEFNWGVYQNCLIKIIIIWYCCMVCAYCHMFVA